MKLTGKIIGIQQPPDKQAGRADITAKLDDITRHAATQDLFQFSQQHAQLFEVYLVGNNRVFGEELVGYHDYSITTYSW